MPETAAKLAIRLEVEKRRRDVLALRIAGFSMAKIGESMGLSKSAVHGHIKRALNDLAEKDTEATARYRNLNMQRFDTLLTAVWQKATTEKDLKAIREARNIVTAMGKLLGLEAPSKVAFTDPTGEFERKPSDWIMPVPPEQDPQTWASEMQAMQLTRAEDAKRAVQAVLEQASLDAS